MARGGPPHSHGPWGCPPTATPGRALPGRGPRGAARPTQIRTGFPRAGTPACLFPRPPTARGRARGCQHRLRAGSRGLREDGWHNRPVTWGAPRPPKRRAPCREPAPCRFAAPGTLRGGGAGSSARPRLQTPRVALPAHACRGGRRDRAAQHPTVLPRSGPASPSTAAAAAARQSSTTRSAAIASPGPARRCSAGVSPYRRAAVSGHGGASAGRDGTEQGGAGRDGAAGRDRAASPRRPGHIAAASGERGHAAAGPRRRPAPPPPPPRQSPRRAPPPPRPRPPRAAVRRGTAPPGGPPPPSPHFSPQWHLRRGGPPARTAGPRGGSEGGRVAQAAAVQFPSFAPTEEAGRNRLPHIEAGPLPPPPTPKYGCSHLRLRTQRPHKSTRGYFQPLAFSQHPHRLQGITPGPEERWVPGSRGAAGCPPSLGRHQGPQPSASLCHQPCHRPKAPASEATRTQGDAHEPLAAWDVNPAQPGAIYPRGL